MFVKPREDEIFKIPERFKPFVKILDIQIKNDLKMILLDLSVCFEKPTSIWVPSHLLPLYDLTDFYDHRNSKFKYNPKLSDLKIDKTKKEKEALQKQNFQPIFSEGLKNLFKILFNEEISLNNVQKILSTKFLNHHDKFMYNIFSLPKDTPIITIENDGIKLIIKNKDSSYYKSEKYEKTERYYMSANGLMEFFNLDVNEEEEFLAVNFKETNEWTRVLITNDEIKFTKTMYNANPVYRRMCIASQDVIFFPKSHVTELEVINAIVENSVGDFNHPPLFRRVRYLPLYLLALHKKGIEINDIIKSERLMAYDDYYASEDITPLKYKLGYVKKELYLYLPFNGMAETIDGWVPNIKNRGKRDNEFYKNKNPFYYDKSQLSDADKFALDKLRKVFNGDLTHKQYFNHIKANINNLSIPLWLFNIVDGLLSDFDFEGKIPNSIYNVYYSKDNLMFVGDDYYEFIVEESSLLAVFDASLKTCYKFSKLLV